MGTYSGYNCARVIETNLCKSGLGCGLDRADREITLEGDSGGPWFFGNIARGTLVGAINGDDYFVRIGRIANFLDATVLQQ